MPWQRRATRTTLGKRQAAGTDPLVRRYPARWLVLHELGDLLPGCRCHADWVPGVVLDPFFGAGTVGVVAEQTNRDWLGIELNPSYAELAQQRIVAARTAPPRAA
jgi:hypothetical protein